MPPHWNFVNKNGETEPFNYFKDDGSLTLSVKWKELGSHQMLQMFSTVQLSLEPHEKSHFEFNAMLLKPNTMS